MIYRICTKCGETKEATTEFFNKTQLGRLGLRTKCNVCRSQYNKLYRKRRRASDIDFRLKLNLSSAFSRFMKGNKTDKTFNILQFTLEEYKTHLFKDITEEEYINGNYHIDHLIPISLYDSSNHKHILKCWNLRNLRVLDAKENQSKNDKLDMDLIKQYGIEDLLP